MGTSTCPICNGSGERGGKSCPACGGSGQVADSSSSSSSSSSSYSGSGRYGYSGKSWGVLVVLSIFLGTLGVDRFYAGRIGLGIIKLLSNFVGIGVIWWLIDIFLALTGRQKDGYGDYITRGTSSGGCLGNIIVLLIIVGVLGGGVYWAWKNVGPVVSKVPGISKLVGLESASQTNATITADAANFRAGPGTSYKVIKTLKKGETLTVTGATENGWVPVKHGNDKGWISADLIGK